MTDTPQATQQYSLATIVFQLMIDATLRSEYIRTMAISQKDGEIARAAQKEQGITKRKNTGSAGYSDAADYAQFDKFLSWKCFDPYRAIVPTTINATQDLRHFMAAYVQAYPTRFDGDTEFLEFRFTHRSNETLKGPTMLMGDHDTLIEIAVTRQGVVDQLDAMWFAQQHQHVLPLNDPKPAETPPHQSPAHMKMMQDSKARLAALKDVPETLLDIKAMLARQGRLLNIIAVKLNVPTPDLDAGVFMQLRDDTDMPVAPQIADSADVTAPAE